MAEKRDYYEVLGVSKSATQEEIKKAYRKITKENHPDLHPGDKECEERFKEANEAMQPLTRMPATVQADSADLILVISAIYSADSAIYSAADSADSVGAPDGQIPMRREKEAIPGQP